MSSSENESAQYINNNITEMKNDEGEMVSDNDEIKEIYKNRYEEPFEKRKEEFSEEDNIEASMDKIRRLAENQELLS